jgi:hypothetical protein
VTLVQVLHHTAYANAHKEKHHGLLFATVIAVFDVHEFARLSYASLIA